MHHLNPAFQKASSNNSQQLIILPQAEDTHLVPSGNLGPTLNLAKGVILVANFLLKLGFIPGSMQTPTWIIKSLALGLKMSF